MIYIVEKAPQIGNAWGVTTIAASREEFLKAFPTFLDKRNRLMLDDPHDAIQTAIKKNKQKLRMAPTQKSKAKIYVQIKSLEALITSEQAIQLFKDNYGYKYVFDCFDLFDKNPHDTELQDEWKDFIRENYTAGVNVFFHSIDIDNIVDKASKHVTKVPYVCFNDDQLAAVYLFSWHGNV